MRFVFYCHSLASDWNHGNAHFLRGVMRELVARGHEAVALAPFDAWSRANLVADQGFAPLDRFETDFPELEERLYERGFDHSAALDGADVVVVHEWTDPAIVAKIGWLRREGAPFTLLFHDTHHRAVSAEKAIAGLELRDYDGVLAFGEALAARYRAAGWGRQVHVWHEAADARLFRPMPEIESTGDLIWIGNWGDGERDQQLRDFLVDPVRDLGLKAEAWGVRYPPHALAALEEAGIAYRGWIANADAPEAFARHRATVHVPRRPYVESLPGIPTIRVFEALACGIPLVCAPWDDAEGLFRPGEDYLVAEDGAAMRGALRTVLNDRERAAALAASGLETIRARHTCAHRVDELIGILADLGVETREQETTQTETAP
jgi:spore maturation protein CgeB